MKELLTIFFICLVVGAMINGQGSSSPAPTPEPQSESGNSVSVEANPLMPELNETEFALQVLNSDEPVLVDFYTTWCVPCKKMTPILEQLASEYSGRARVFRVDTDKCPKLAKEYSVAALPTFMFFNKGKQVDAVAGATSKEALSAILELQLAQ